MRKAIIPVLFSLMLIMVLGLAACGGSTQGSTQGSSSSQSVQDPAQTAYDEACALFDEGKFYSAKIAFENSKYRDWEQRAAECVQTMPETGELWHSASMKSDEMILEFAVVDSEAGIGRYIGVYTEKKELAATVFIQGTGSVSIDLPGGNYYVKQAMGTEWYGEDELFGADGRYETMVFEEFENDRYLTQLDAGYVWTISINTSSDQGQGVGSEEGDWDSWD